MNDQGVPQEFHTKGCGVWVDEDCDCVHSMDEDARREYWEIENLKDQDAWMFLPEPIDPLVLDPSEYADWEENNPPRISKGAKPKMEVSGRSIFDLVREIVKRGKK